MLKKIPIAILVLGCFVFVAFATWETSKDPYPAKPEQSNEAYPPTVVLELFTSQGCSSCPPADRLLENMGRDFNTVIALSYHVDYWDYIGWEDPFGKPRHTQKQRDYNQQFKSNTLYTPQMVVNGREHFVGSNANRLYAAVTTYGKKKSTNRIVPSKVNRGPQKVTFEYDVSGELEGRAIKALLVLNKRETPINRGENRNRTLTNTNIVVSEKTIASNSTHGNGFISIPKLVREKERISLVLLIQRSDHEITAASKTAL